ncbi:YbhB/YbcL family Raf kinase inhibitor-like protein [Desulfovibrio inopinatus]|uniref:YbhB/YbcL family Raf kinase inhibitor-like protein n=1 Tax=Desulfovibrio inopinatus TaxID=102109 RepID=UPI000409CABB|nr:YbhB/YbcL family Raf kinase inhibitor-like protein [Desulfovibrio inopinatus]
MRRTVVGMLALLIVSTVLVFSTQGSWAADFTLTSPTVENGGTLADAHLFKGFGCSGDNVSPALSWSNPPSGTKSFALMVYDPDAPTGSGWWHWVVFNIPASVYELAEGAGNPGGTLPAGAVQSRTDFGSPGYGGACPPKGHGAHHYIFTVYALDVEKIDLGPESSAAMVGFYLNAHTLGKASLTATYGR